MGYTKGAIKVCCFLRMVHYYFEWERRRLGNLHLKKIFLATNATVVQGEP